jgi:YHS domain-containing protein
LQPLLDESGMNGDTESLELDGDDDDPKIAGQAPQALPSDTADGAAESPYTGVKISPNETEQQLASSRPRAEAADETPADEAQADSSAKDAGDAASKTADSAAKSYPGAAVAKKPAKPANDDFDLNEDDEDDDDGDMLALPRGDSGKHAEVVADKAEKAPEKLVEPAPFSGLKGICPVVLKDNRKLVDAQPGIKSEFNGKTYTFSSIEAKKTFDENPRKYAPVGGGNDVVKQTSGEAGVAGTLEHAAWYRGRLYLFSTADSRHEFVEAPSKFVVED